ncbi:MAG: STAS-like domain-containing protein [Butyribacter sp.]|jgi:hypothetical protein|uniref:DUF4325 domain-containing protein n=1 Tax=Butyribacter intestini TaxID=1703332 RepID=A0AAW3JT60_9FIRM|nr:hypothetical protein APZ18_12420 [Butyribacter intestini]MBS5364556.1 STAS-like domain-containing protein [Clostridium sp.]MCQ5165458.1 STAS-like domain-containing protein [Roseburia hominis]CCZ41556.1 putative uncharacterized protein [Clostridium sp. CAG:122]DAP16098.1 MAG TPA: protein of unknown function DUF4325 [Caudoviricetes sp.]
MDIVLNVAELIGSPSALTREQGAIVFDEIVPLLKEGKKVVLDFGEIESIITPFLNVSIGKLYEKFSSDELQKKLEIINRPDMTTRKFQIVIDNAKSYYSDKRRFENAIEEVIDNYEK